MDDRYVHWYPYEQEARYYGKETYESQESMKSFLYEEKFANDIANGQKIMSSPLSRFEEQLKEVGFMSNEHIGKKISIGEPSGPWSKKRKIEESARSQEIFLNAHVSHEVVFGKLLKGSLCYHPSYIIVCILKSSQGSTFLEYLLVLGDDHSCGNSLYDSRMNDYYSYLGNVDSFVLEVENKEQRMLRVFENKGKSLEKEPLNLQEETTMRFSLNPSPLYYEFSFKEINLLLESLSFHVSICGNACVIFLDGNLCLLVPCMTKSYLLVFLLRNNLWE
ncbi:hypothetical protein M9H77_36410 [Catharanthus roseus]|uniref:Uncharacterized protein n=1 Tax=Catharanthus roseus TaxID=4058 RepID=A0ACB9ZS39_CATRO|nr:hypothetical protein M9H77_36410 [Catharanthus roseus]